MGAVERSQDVLLGADSLVEAGNVENKLFTTEQQFALRGEVEQVGSEDSVIGLSARKNRKIQRNFR